MLELNLSNLRKPSVNISEEFMRSESKIIYDKLIKNYIKLGGGAGLSAPQIGIHRKMFIWTPTRDIKTLKVAINSNIVYGDSKVTSYESCYSMPGSAYKVMRSSQIQMAYYDLEGNYKKENFCNFEAIVIQHEHDHLNGILICDHGEISNDQRIPQTN